MPYKGKMHRFKYHFGCSIETRFWDPKKQRPRLVGKNYEYLGSILEQIKTIESLCNDILKEHNFSISPKKLKQELDTRRGITKKPVSGESAKPVIPALMQFLDIYLEERKNAASYKWGSWKVLHTWATHLKDFSATQRKPLDYADINSQFLPVFKNWLCAPERKLSANYIAKGISVVKQFMLEARRRKYHDNADFVDFSHQKEKVAKVSLSFEELESLAMLDLGQYPMLDKARDLFLIGAYTGLRYSDFTSIRPEHIREESGKRYLMLHTQKTNTAVTIPLFPIADKILQKYRYATPKLSNQKMNIALKELGEKAHLNHTVVDVRTKGGKRVDTSYKTWERLSSHAARRSFATNFFLSGIPAAILMQITGHSTEKQFMQYINVDPKANAARFAELAKGLMEGQGRGE
jgi:integrase